MHLSLSRGTSSQHNQKSLCNLARPESDKKRPDSELVTNLWWLFPHGARPASRKSHGERVCVGFYLSRSSGNRPQVSERALDLYYIWRYQCESCMGFYVVLRDMLYVAPMNWLDIILNLNAAIKCYQSYAVLLYNFTSRAASNRLVEPSAGGVSKMLPPFFRITQKRRVECGDARCDFLFM